MARRVLTLKERKLVAELTPAGLLEAEKFVGEQQLTALVEKNARVLKRTSEILEVIAQVKVTRKMERRK